MGKPRQPGQIAHLNALRHDERETRRAKAWALRLDGFTVRQIAERLNVSVGGAAQYLQESLAELRTNSHESADSWRQLQLDRLESVIAAWLPIARDPAHPEAARGAAVVVRACETQARLLGLLQTGAVVSTPEKPAAESESFEHALAASPALREAVREQLNEAEARSIIKPATP